jgi:hypothetical protein
MTDYGGEFVFARQELGPKTRERLSACGLYYFRGVISVYTQ